MESIQTNSKLSFLNGGGEMGKLIRSYNWNSTSVGNPDEWPQSLYTTLNIILNSKFPMFLWWGEDLIQFYNDAYRPSLGDNGKHPWALGKTGRACWQEIWPTIKPLIDQVFAGGESVWSENQLIPIYRNGKLEDVYWTFSYSAVKVESGKVGGVLVVCNETTEMVNHIKIIREKEQLFRNIFIQAPVAAAIMQGEQFVVDFANKKMLQIWGRTLEQVIDKPVFEALPEARGQGLEALLNNVYTTGQGYAANELAVDLLRNGKLEKTYVSFVYEPYYNLDGKINGVVALANEVTDQVAAVKRIADAEEKARVAIESAGLGFYEAVLLTNELITDKVFDTALGLTPPIIYADVIAALHPEDKEVRNKAFADALQTGHLKYEARFVWKDGSIHWIRVTGKVIYDQAGKPEKMAGVVQDITAQKDLDRHKDEFISMVSHELKTPLTSAIGYNAILKENLALLKGDQSMSIVSRMEKQLSRLKYIIQDLTEVTRIENSQIKFRENEFDFREFLAETIEAVESSTETHKIVSNIIDTATVCADKERTSQVVTNLLNNAIKYSPAGSEIVVTACLQHQEIICSIKDNGPGVPKHKQSKIFEKFYQVVESGKPNSGFGLGLYISAEIIRKQHGRIWVESVDGEGSTFYFSLPVLK